MTDKIKILIIDDHPLMRRGIKQLIELEKNFEVVGDAGSGNEGIALALKTQPDLIILDLNMKGLSGLDTLKSLRNEDVDARIVILTVSDAKSEVILSDSIKDLLLERSSSQDPIHALTDREMDVLQLIAKGLSNKQIAAQLFISEETVKVHIRNLLRKLNVHSRVAATVLYLNTKGHS